MRSRRRLPFWIILLGVLACRTKDRSLEAPGNARRYPVRGVVQSVDTDRKEISLAHEAIPGFMDAMTMDFEVEDTAAWKGLRPRMKIQATLVVDGDRHWLEGITPAPDAPAAKIAAPHVVTPEPNRAVPLGEKIPDFTLTDQTGKRVALSDMRGETVGVSFIYTRCPIATACPMTTAKFSKLDAMLRDEPVGKLFVITVEPEHDTPRVLAEYARKAGADPARWKFLTGTPREVADVASRFGVLYYPERGQVIHTQAVAVVDPKGRLSSIYYGERWEPEHLLRDMKKARGG